MEGDGRGRQEESKRKEHSSSSSFVEDIQDIFMTPQTLQPVSHTLASRATSAATHADLNGHKTTDRHGRHSFDEQVARILRSTAEEPAAARSWHFRSMRLSRCAFTLCTHVLHSRCANRGGSQVGRRGRFGRAGSGKRTRRGWTMPGKTLRR